MGDISLGVATDKAAINSGVIKGASIDNCVIGATTAVAGSFTTLASSGNTTLGDAATDTLGFYGVATPIAQRAAAAQGALTLTTSTSGGFGFATSAAFTAFTAQLEEMRATLVAVGLMKGAA